MNSRDTTPGKPRRPDKELEIETEGSTLDRFESLTRRLLGVSRTEIRQKKNGRKNGGNAVQQNETQRKASLAETTDQKIEKLRARVEDLALQIQGLGNLMGNLIAEVRKARASLDELREAGQQDRQSDPKG